MMDVRREVSEVCGRVDSRSATVAGWGPKPKLVKCKSKEIESGVGVYYHTRLL